MLDQLKTILMPGRRDSAANAAAAAALREMLIDDDGVRLIESDTIVAEFDVQQYGSMERAISACHGWIDTILDPVIRGRWKTVTLEAQWREANATIIRR